MINLKDERILSVSAIIISLATLFLIFYQTNLIRKEQKASVLPSLIIGYSFEGGGDRIDESIWVTNQGLGPAFIDEIRILQNDKEYNTDPYGYLVSNYDREEISFINRIVPGRIIPANEGITLVKKVTDSTSQIVLSNTFEFPYEISQMPADNPNKAVIEIIYKNVYGDRWKISSDKSTPTEID